MKQLDDILTFILEKRPKVFQQVCIRKFKDFATELKKVKPKSFLSFVFYIIDMDIQTTKQTLKYERVAQRNASTGKKTRSVDKLKENFNEGQMMNMATKPNSEIAVEDDFGPAANKDVFET